MLNLIQMRQGFIWSIGSRVYRVKIKTLILPVEANNCSASHEILRLLWNQKMHQFFTRSYPKHE
jgi:hypothetical protein